ncbi:MAG: cell wall hydrolase [Clostridia bacterium]|nr:cell wall hydrolase [Clostridia bacterium]
MKKQFLTFCLAFAFFSTLLIFITTPPKSAKASSFSDADIQLMARCVNGEARGEPFAGQVAVAAVILNRVKHPSFPNTISGVIYQPGAFTATVDGQINVPIAEDSTVYKACQDALNGWDPSGGAIYYYNPAKTTNKWIWSRPIITVIGRHNFAG